ncbi:MAG: hypothetical protein AAGA39_04760 [Pseudomonadota bacterium]
MTKLMAAALAMLCLWSSANASTVTSFTSEADYIDAAGGTSFSLNFDGLSGMQDGNFAGLIDFNSPAAATFDNVNFVSGQLTDAGSEISFNNVGPIQGVFANEVSAFAFEIFDGAAGAHTLSVFDSSFNVLATISTPVNGFVGVVSDMPIGAFVLSGASFGPLAPDRVFIDNFEAQVVVPIPPAIALFAGGLALIQVARQRASTEAA